MALRLRGTGWYRKASMQAESAGADIKLHGPLAAVLDKAAVATVLLYAIQVSLTLAMAFSANRQEV